MIPEELEKLVIKHKEEGHLPFFVNCTTGTTVYGAYDPISEIAGESLYHYFYFSIKYFTIPIFTSVNFLLDYWVLVY